ncbi:hypothetical protein E6C60_0237 [Paenibacillus algicola]|uniref:Uncharacterized protein n=1 Tax=Paenibacillus algicola TaxID=2565926 RepID=A0A4P8XFU9_9BACL|nr:hypothetical protein E6C60_0237 [Paenibacillus algicola]
MERSKGQITGNIKGLLPGDLKSFGSSPSSGFGGNHYALRNQTLISLSSRFAQEKYGISLM